MNEAAVLCGVQLLAATALGAAGWALLGTAVLWVPAMGLFGGAWWFATRLARRSGGLDRARVRRWSAVSGLVHATFAGGGYALAYTVAPGAFAFPSAALPVMALGVATVVGLTALVLTLCAADMAAARFGALR